MVNRREEEYIEAIYKIEKKKGYARVSDISKEMGVGLSATSEMFKKLGEKGYINYERYGVATLTKEGEKLARNLEKKHKAIRDFFIILGLDRKIADESACKMEHMIHPEVMERIAKFVDFIKTYEKPVWIERFRKYCETGEIPNVQKPKREK